MMMRVAIASVMQESNTFSPRPTTFSDFQIEPGPETVRAYRGTNTEMGGFLQEIDILGWEAVPLISVYALAGGPVENATFDKICGLLFETVSKGRFDALVIALHGAWLGESYPSADAELVRRVVAKLGRDVPIVATLDLHANVRPELLEGLWGVVGYRTYPHVDMAETGRKAVRMLRDMVKDGRRPRYFWLPFPFIAPPQSAATDRAPLKDALLELDQDLASFDIASASFFCVQPWLDVPEMGSSFVIASKEPSPEISAVVQRAAQRLWHRRAELEVEWVQPENLLDRLGAFPAGPVVVSEAYDGPTGGATGDHPGLLAALLPYSNKVSACLYVVDPGAVDEAIRVGVGGEFAAPVAACFDKRWGPPVAISGTVRHLSDGQFTLRGPAFTGKKLHMGPTAVLQAGLLDIVISKRAVMMIDPELYRSQGVEPREKRIVGVKSPTLFRPAYEELMIGVLHLDMPGVCRGDLRHVPFQQLARPIFPLDDFPWQSRAEGIWV